MPDAQRKLAVVGRRSGWPAARGRVAAIHGVQRLDCGGEVAAVEVNEEVNDTAAAGASTDEQLLAKIDCEPVATPMDRTRPGPFVTPAFELEATRHDLLDQA
jgi:hypothetical protein